MSGTPGPSHVHQTTIAGVRNESTNWRQSEWSWRRSTSEDKCRLLGTALPGGKTSHEQSRPGLRLGPFDFPVGNISSVDISGRQPSPFRTASQRKDQNGFNWPMRGKQFSVCGGGWCPDGGTRYLVITQQTPPICLTSRLL